MVLKKYNKIYLIVTELIWKFLSNFNDYTNKTKKK